MAWSKSALVVLGLILVLTVILRSFFIEVLWVQTQRFAPVLLPGDLVLSVRGHQPERGDFVSYTCPKRPFCLAQIAGIPGDRIDNNSGTISVNDKAWVGEAFSLSDAAPLGFESLVVPPSHFFVLGDTAGLENASHITSVFNRILFSVDGAQPGVRWTRIGQTTH